MHTPRSTTLSIVMTLLLFIAAIATSGCATGGSATSTNAAAVASANGRVPDEIDIGGALAAGSEWKSRFVSTSEIRRVLKAGASPEKTVSRAVGLELVSTQTVSSFTGKLAVVEVDELAVRILQQDGKFIEAPFRAFNPPSKFSFSVDLSDGKVDFGNGEKAFREWSAAIAKGPFGQIVGRSFRVDDYVAQIREIYTKPFVRFSGKSVTTGGRSLGEDLILPFIGPTTSLRPIAAPASAKLVGVETVKGILYAKVAGEFSSPVAPRNEPSEVAAAYSDFKGLPVPTTFQRTASAHGSFTASVDANSGREVRSSRTFTFNSTTTSSDSVLTEEIVGKFVIEPAQ